jgi:O-antigen/teichoic acid export membrane protein
MTLPIQSSTTVRSQNSRYAESPLARAPLQLRSHAGQMKWVVLGKLGLAGANAALLLVLAQLMELELYGLMVTAIGAQLILSRVLLLGVDSGMIRLRTVPELRERAHEVVQAGVNVLLRRIGVLILALLLAAPLLLSPAAREPGLVISSVAFGGIATALTDYAYFYWLANLNYRAAALVHGGTAVARLALTIAIALLFPRQPLLIFVAYPLASLIYGVLQAAAFKHGKRTRSEPALIQRLLRYSSWQGGADIAQLLSMYVGTFILVLLGQPAAAGLFGLSLTLSMGFIVIYQAYGDYLYPRVAQVESFRALARFLRHSLMATVGVIVACLPIGLAIGVLVPWFLRTELHSVVPIFYCVGASFLLLIFLCPLKLACHYLLRPHFLFIGASLRLVLVAILGSILAAEMGAMGMAIAQLAGTAISILVLALLFARSLQSARTRGAQEFAFSQADIRKQVTLRNDGSYPAG